MALGLVCVIVAVLTAATGYWFPPVGIAPAQAVDGITLLFLVMAAASLDKIHHRARWQALGCRR